MRKIRVKIDTRDGIVYVKQGRFGSATQYGGGWYTDHSINEIIADFCSRSVRQYEKEISRVIKK